MNQHNIGTMFEDEIVNNIWPSMNVKVIKKFTNKLDQRMYGDYQITIDGVLKNVDVKAEKNMPPNFPIEIMQDWPSMDIGWFHTLTACDEIWYGRYKDKLESVYRISVRRLRSNAGNWKAMVSDRGYGKTIFIQAPIDDLIDKKICVKVWDQENNNGMV